jgi:hypothetical protein
MEINAFVFILIILNHDTQYIPAGYPSCIVVLKKIKSNARVLKS